MIFRTSLYVAEKFLLKKEGNPLCGNNMSAMRQPRIDFKESTIRIDIYAIDFN